MPEAIGAGITTVIGGGTGPAEGTKATMVTPGAWNLARMLEATERIDGEVIEEAPAAVLPMAQRYFLS